MDVAGWAHLVDAKRPWAKTFHYQRYRLGGTVGDNYEGRCEKLELLTDGTNCRGNWCMVKIIEHFYASVSTPEGDEKRVKVRVGVGVRRTRSGLEIGMWSRARIILLNGTKCSGRNQIGNASNNLRFYSKVTSLQS